MGTSTTLSSPCSLNMYKIFSCTEFGFFWYYSMNQLGKQIQPSKGKKNKNTSILNLFQAPFCGISTKASPHTGTGWRSQAHTFPTFCGSSANLCQHYINFSSGVLKQNVSLLIRHDVAGKQNSSGGSADLLNGGSHRTRGTELHGGKARLGVRKGFSAEGTRTGFLLQWARLRAVSVQAAMVSDMGFEFWVVQCGNGHRTQWFSWVPSNSVYSMIIRTRRYSFTITLFQPFVLVTGISQLLKNRFNYFIRQKASHSVKQQGYFFFYSFFQLTAGIRKAFFNYFDNKNKPQSSSHRIAASNSENLQLGFTAFASIRYSFHLNAALPCNCKLSHLDTI